MKKYECIKLEDDAEIYRVNGQYIKAIWGYSTGSEKGPHNTFDTDACVYKWTGEDCTVEALPKVTEGGWKAVVGFDLDCKNTEIDWDAYGKRVDEILAEIEGEE